MNGSPFDQFKDISEDVSLSFSSNLNSSKKKLEKSNIEIVKS